MSASAMVTLLKRFKRAGWVVSFEVAGEKHTADFTRLGLRRLEALAKLPREVLNTLEPTSVEACELGEIIGELCPPNLTAHEFTTLINFAADFRP
jgi:hypothetical protein